VLLTLLNVLDFGMNAQEAVDAPRFNHQWLPASSGSSATGSRDTVEALAARGHKVQEVERQGVAEAILVGELLEGAATAGRPTVRP